MGKEENPYPKYIDDEFSREPVKNVKYQLWEDSQVKRKPEASDVRDSLITEYCQECPDHDEYDCADHECFIWEIFGILMEVEK